MGTNLCKARPHHKLWVQSFVLFFLNSSDCPEATDSIQVTLRYIIKVGQSGMFDRVWGGVMLIAVEPFLQMKLILRLSLECYTSENIVRFSMLRFSSCSSRQNTSWPPSSSEFAGQRVPSPSANHVPFSCLRVAFSASP